MFGRKKQKEPDMGYYAISLKGIATLAAIDSGLCEEMPDGSGWNIGPFLAFWDQFEKELAEAQKRHKAQKGRTEHGLD